VVFAKDACAFAAAVAFSCATRLAFLLAAAVAAVCLLLLPLLLSLRRALDFCKG